MERNSRSRTFGYLDLSDSLVIGSSGGITISQAWDELERHEFGAWIRMMVEPEKQLTRGRKAMAKQLGYSRQAFNEILRRLADKEFIQLVPDERPCFPTLIKIIKRPMLVGRDHFIKLTRI